MQTQESVGVRAAVRKLREASTRELDLAVRIDKVKLLTYC